MGRTPFRREALRVFAVSGLHNVVHLVSGVVGVALARTYAASRAYFLGGGLVYLALWLHGLFMDQGSRTNLLPVNGADNWLHFGLGMAWCCSASPSPVSATRPSGVPGPASRLAKPAKRQRRMRVSLGRRLLSS